MSTTSARSTVGMFSDATPPFVSSPPSPASPTPIDDAAPLHLTAKPQLHELVESVFPRRRFGTHIQPIPTSASHKNLYAFGATSDVPTRFHSDARLVSAEQLDESQVAWTLAGLATIGEDWTHRPMFA